MPSRTFHWYTAGICLVPATALAASFVVGEVAHSAPPGTTEQIAAEAADPTKPMITLSTNPVSPVASGTPVTLTAQLSAANAVGTVQFKEGTTLLDTAAVSNGIANSKPLTFTSGTHALTATFVPGSAAYLESTTVSPVTLEVRAADTRTTLSTMPTGQAAERELVTLNAMVSPSNAVGTVQFWDGGVELGEKPVVNGVATGTTSRLGAGSHALTAVFIPTNRADFNQSMSEPSSLTITRSGPAALVSLDSQDAVLSLDLGPSILDGHPGSCDGRGSLDGRQDTADDRRTHVDGRVAILDGRPLLNVVLDLG